MYSSSDTDQYGGTLELLKLRLAKDTVFNTKLLKKDQQSPQKHAAITSPAQFPSNSLTIIQRTYNRSHVQQKLNTMRIRDRSTVYLYSISVCMGSLILGYELTSYGLPSSLIPQANEFASPQIYNNYSTLLTSILPLAAIFGASIYRFTIKQFGFVNTFLYLDYATILAAFIGALNLSVSTQLLSRLLLGVVVGLNTIIIPTYLTSCLPGSMGGPAGTLNQLFITIGIFLGYLFNYAALDSGFHDLGWRIVIAFPILPALLRLHTAKNVFPYETVQMMIETNNDYLLHRYVDHIWQDVTLEQFKESKKMAEEDILAENATAFQEFGQSFRRRFTLVCFIIVFNQFSGSSTSFALAQTVFPVVAGPAASDTTWAYVKLTFLQVIVTFLAGQFLEKYGRRSFMLEGLRIIFVANILLGLIEWAAPELKGLEYFVIFAHIVGFSLSFGPCSFLLATELMHDITYPTILFWVSIFAFGLINPELLASFGPAKVYFTLAAVSIVGIVYIAAYLVETQGKSRQQVYKEFRDMCFPLSLKWRQFLTKRGTVDQHRTQQLLDGKERYDASGS